MIKSLIIRFFEAFSKPAHLSIKKEDRQIQGKLNPFILSYRNMIQKIEDAKVAQKEMQPFYDEAVKQMENYKPISPDNYVREPFSGDVMRNGWKISGEYR